MSSLHTAPTGAPQNLTGSSLNSNSIFISWNLPLPSERNGIILNYIVNVTETETNLKFSHIALSTSFTLFGLHPYYTYSITVTAVTVVSPGPATNPISITTDEDSKRHNHYVNGVFMQSKCCTHLEVPTMHQLGT